MKKVSNAIEKLNGTMRWHWDDKAAQTLTQNQQLLIDQYGTRDITQAQRMSAYATTEATEAGGTVIPTLNPAVIRVRETVKWTVFNTGASMIHFRLNLWRARKDIFSIAGQTDTIANQIAHGLALMTPGTVSGAGAFSSTIPGYSLFYNPFFCRMWKAVKKYTFTLAPGENRTFFLKDHYIYNEKETESNGTAAVAFLKGCTHIVGYAYGQPAFDVNAGAAPTNIGTAAGGIIGYVLGDSKISVMPVANEFNAARTTTFNMATAGHVWAPIAPSETTVTLF